MCVHYVFAVTLVYSSIYINIHIHTHVDIKVSYRLFDRDIILSSTTQIVGSIYESTADKKNVNPTYRHFPYAYSITVKAYRKLIEAYPV